MVEETSVKGVVAAVTGKWLSGRSVNWAVLA